MSDQEVDGEWVPNGEQPAEPYDPGPVDDEIAADQYFDSELLEGLDNVPRKAEILAGLEEFRAPFTETRRRELAAALWPDYRSEIWTGAWETPGPEGVDPQTGELVNGVRWSDTAGCPVHVQATSDQEQSISEQAVNDANAAVDQIVQRYETIFDDTRYDNSLLTAQRMVGVEAALRTFSQDELGLFGSIRELFETHWTGDLASDKGHRYFGADVMAGASQQQTNLAAILLNYAIDELRAQVVVHATLGQAVYDSYKAMAEKTHLSLDIGVLQSIADVIGTIGLLDKVPGLANATGWLSSMTTKQGDFKITVTWENVATSDDIQKWTADLLGAVDTSESGIKAQREALGAQLQGFTAGTNIGSVTYIPGEGYQDE
ncbi:hypothetical protein LO763_01765 [Glycomyces sp. A-F 0318]|uniref:hypothetical protein n=1 Tax=Glycomyces amatae TaxID=2881355 RepID=UPI001E52DB63|nr:hypothetical protein [Glycomyces amatae]MCD0442353.1 hypothetical protein [Glycomyces amatae]